ncbi:MAG: sigma 54-interacting transcriptional regulator [Desulfobacterales bacterium]|nr:sigma 54-interacting transcriptional regulator [Desulfobacterales bacterium]
MPFIKENEFELISIFQAENEISLKTKLMITLIPPVIIILIITAYISYLTSYNFLDIALGRTVKLQAMALGHEIELFFARCKQDILFISQDNLDSGKMTKFLLNLKYSGGITYRKFSYISQNDKSHIFLVANEDEIIQLSNDEISEIQPVPFLQYEYLKKLKKGEVWISNLSDVEYPFPSKSNPNQKIKSKVIYFGTRYQDSISSTIGYLLLAVDVKDIRNILSLYNSPISPISGYPRTQELRYSYFFDKDGWILFQSEDINKKDLDISTDLSRTEYTGTLSKPGLPHAFRPGSVFSHFWKMVRDICEGKHDLLKMQSINPDNAGVKDYYLGYVPIRLPAGEIYGGIAYVDRTRLTIAAGYKQLDIMLILSISTILIVSFIIYIIGYFITKPILTLSEAVANIQKNGDSSGINLPHSSYEISLLQNAINTMILTLRRQIEEIKLKDKKIETVTLKEKVELQTEFPSAQLLTDDIPSIVGFGQKIEELKSNILKAANAEADVLIIGETGTGKQLTAEAIHKYSRRKLKQFISINCGELNENLLLDTLFGHIKGAFTEAKTDRKGAFIESDGGTLFLDEIQTASSSVQQALLRAISIRKIKQLGSDKEIDVDVKLIAATNVDLRTLIDQKLFRSDLYFRLKVITIHTPPLREQKENIPVLINYFLNNAKSSVKRDKIGISKGALEKMKQYDWPGNVRELMNTITRAVIMTEGEIIQAEDIKIDIENPFEDNTYETQSETLDNSNSFSETTIFPNFKIKMNWRQQKAYPVILINRTITRNEYQNIVGGNISVRTAGYDLQDLVKKGILKREGSGPSTRYILAEQFDMIEKK